MKACIQQLFQGQSYIYSILFHHRYAQEFNKQGGNCVSTDKCVWSDILERKLLNSINTVSFPVLYLSLNHTSKLIVSTDQ